MYKKGQKGKKEVSEQKRKDKEKNSENDKSREEEEEDEEERMEEEPEAEEEDVENWASDASLLLAEWGLWVTMVHHSDVTG